MKEKEKDIRVLVVGCGNMGASHALAYHSMEGFKICGLVSRGESKNRLNEKLGNKYDLFDDYETALKKTQPDAVCISTYPDTHEEYAILAMKNGCHVFVEKPLATTVEGAVAVFKASQKYNRKLVVGYILRFHPTWEKFIEMSHELGKPLVMRMNLNQQSEGYMWDVHRNLMDSLSPIVDCGVHYVDVMSQMTRSRPKKVTAIGARLTDDIPKDNYNYGQLQIRYEDGSVGWYEAGWGPMISETAFFIKDVIGPKGSVSIVANNVINKEGNSDSVEDHTKAESLRRHYADIDDENCFEKENLWVQLDDEPDHQELCNREQYFFLEAIQKDIDLTNLIKETIESLQIVLACDESIKKGIPIELDPLW